MACDDADTVAAALLAAAVGPQSVSVDGMTTQQQPLKDLIELDKYLRRRCATTRAHRGIRFTRLVPPGTT